MTYLMNAIPGSIIPGQGVALMITPVSPQEVGESFRRKECLSAVGHADTAKIISGMIGAEVPVARVNVPALEDLDFHFLALYQGPRLAEGATELPEGATLSFFALQAADRECLKDRITDQILQCFDPEDAWS